MGRIFDELMSQGMDFVGKYCVQTFTFGQHNHHDLGNNHRPLWRLSWPKAKFYPNNIRMYHWRQENGDKRADPRGRVPGDVFDFTRVTGNSKQRRPWHPTQLNEALVERCILMSTKPGDTVIDPFAGTGTTLRVCDKIDRQCTLIEFDSGYCKKIAEEHNLRRHTHHWSR
jgi:DNA modification methylase